MLSQDLPYGRRATAANVSFPQHSRRSRPGIRHLEADSPDSRGPGAVTDDRFVGKRTMPAASWSAGATLTKEKGQRCGARLEQRRDPQCQL